MFVLIQKLIKSVSHENVTNIDEKMLKLAENFIKKEYIIVRYTEDNKDVPVPLAFVYKQIDKVTKWKRKWEQSQDLYGYHCNRTGELNMQIERHRDEIEKLKAENLGLMQRVPYLDSQIYSY